jgi:hypothetical protein
LRDIPVDWMVGRQKYIEEEVERSSGGDDSDVADADPLPPIFDRELHSWPRDPEWGPSFLSQ